MRIPVFVSDSRTHFSIRFTLPKMSTFHSPPCPSMHAQRIATASSTGTTRPQVSSRPRTDSLSVGSAVFTRARVPRSAYKEVAIGDRVMETRVGAGSVFVKNVRTISMASTGENAVFVSVEIESDVIRTGSCNKLKRILDTRV
jgi:hypothetical protein